MNEGLSVSELNLVILESLRREPRLRNVTVTAEISGFKHYLSSGHWYFALKDAQASIPCVMFRQNTVHAALKPKDGDRVTVNGYVELYPRDGRVQFYILSLKAAGVGSLHEQFEALKQKLQAEGLFDPGRKRILPQIPKKVAVITSASGAALHDILSVSGMRNPSIPIVLIPSAVQGEGAGAELAAAVRKVSALRDVDVVLIGRGGGSQEDLWCFNDEGLARAIASCPVPVVSGVGHEVDFTICDFVSDVRASTPSNAAEIIFPDLSELRNRVRLFGTALSRAMNQQVHSRMLLLHQHRERLQMFSPERRLHRLRERVDQLRHSLEKDMLFAVREKEDRLTEARVLLLQQMDRKLRDREYLMGRLQTRLEAISPLKVLERGYALVYDSEDRVIPDAGRAQQHTDMRIRFRDGSVQVSRKEKG
jgi:exodeoxyribonuclease VII large subunit